MTTLLDAIIKRDRKAVEASVGSVKNLNDPLDQGASVLFAAILAGDRETVRILLDAGADPNMIAGEPAATIYAPKPLELAMTARHLMSWDVYHPIVLLLHQYGATDSDGESEGLEVVTERERRSREWQSNLNPPTPAAPPTPPTLRPRDVLLLEYLQEHDAACPVCGYNVRALTRPVCPECKQQLTISVGAANLHLGWLFAAVAPGFFSGVAALFVLIPTLGRPLFGDGRWEPIIVGLDLFGWCSVIIAILLARKRGRIWFLALPLWKQRLLAIMMWAIHIAAFGLFVLLAVMHL